MGLAIVFLSIAFFIELPQLWEGVFALIGAALLRTGLTRYCPVNRPLAFAREPR